MRVSPGKVRVQFKDPVTDKVTQIDFNLVMASGKWRIADIIYSEHSQQSLKKILSMPLPKS
jgi:ABC-type transporter MlaC component